MNARSSDTLVEVSGLTKYFYQNTTILDRLDPNTSREKVHAVDGVDLSIQRGESIGIVGESGCGKSTLARTILRLIEPTDGSIYFDGEDITNYEESQLKEFRRKAQLVYQDPTASLNARHAIRRIIRKPMEIHGIGESLSDRNERVRDLVHRVGLDEDYLEFKPHELSGGQRQRVAIARALSLEPELLIADEPTSTLDASVQARILNLLDRLQREENLTMMLISHDLSVIEYIADRVSIMYLGQVVESAPTEDIFEDPKHPYTEVLFSSIPVPDPSQARNRVRLKGDIPSPIDPPSGCRFHTRCPKQIPPEEWTGSQEVWVDLYNVKQKMQEMIEEPEEHSGKEVSPDRILSEFEGSTREMLPEHPSNVLRQIRELLSRDELEEAEELLDSEFVSPCETNPPNPVADEADHEVRCHLYNDQVTADLQLEDQQL